MKSFVFLLAFVTIASCTFDPETFDWTSVKPLSHTKAFQDAFPDMAASGDERVFQSRGGRIVRGEVAGPEDFPFQVGLLLSYHSEQSWCSGSLISRKTVLTAAGCVTGNLEITALLGASDILSKTIQYIPVEKIKIHESFNSRNLDTDIAVLILRYEAELTAEVYPVRLPGSNQASESFVDQTATIAGW